MRYIVLGLARDIEQFRRDRGLKHREVVGVSTRDGHRAARGVSGPCELVTLESWKLASPRVREAVEANLGVLRAIGILAS